MQRLVEIARAAPDATTALEQVSIQISTDKGFSCNAHTGS